MVSTMTSVLSIFAIASVWFRLHSRRRGHRLRGPVSGADDAGMSTAEYAVGTVAAVAFAVVLYKVVRSPAVSSALSDIVQSALHAI